jgi:hypothetical protein
MKNRGYLPEYHCFQYRAWAPWPVLSDQQQDWIDAVDTVESWLETSVGPHYELWAWDRVDLAVQGHFLGVAFARDPHRTLFLLRWGMA